MPLSSGARYAEFTIAEFLGSGDGGASYRAVHMKSGHTVRLKVLDAAPSADPGFRQLFRHTNDALMRLQPPATTPVLNFGEGDGQLWVATDLIATVTAQDLLRQRFASGIPHQSLCVIADHIAESLDATSADGIMHGGVRPTNILLSKPFSKDYRIALTDFCHRAPGTYPKNDPYAAPEALAGSAPTRRSDQFAFAATVFHLLTGERPFRTTPSGHRHFDSQPLQSPSITVEGLEGVFVRAFHADPTARFASCSEFVAALRSPDKSRRPTAPATRPRQTASEAAPISPRPDGAQQSPTGRSVLKPAIAAVVVTVVLTVAAVLFSQDNPPSSPTAALATAPTSQPAVPPASSCQKLDDTVASLSLRDKLAQTLMVGVTGIEDARAVVNDHRVGGIFIGSWTDLTMLESGELRSLQAEQRTLPLAVSVDEEGGRVQRLSSLLGWQDSPRQLVASGLSAQQVYGKAFERGQGMRRYGITIDFAPVVDVTDAADDTVIGDRSFGADPAVVTEYAGAYANGLREAGLLPVLKHFPGHGSASGDSHVNGVTTPSLDQLMTSDLIPYQTLTTQHPVAVMLGHMQVPGLTGTEPASLSRDAYSLLRQGNYGGPPFDGPVFTDDLSSMGAINQHYSVPDAVLKALQAGADTALWISTDEVLAVLDHLESAVKRGELDPARVDDAVRTMAVTKDPSLACTR